MLYYNQIVQIRLAHRLYTDFQYFFQKVSTISTVRGVNTIQYSHIGSVVYASPPKPPPSIKLLLKRTFFQYLPQPMFFLHHHIVYKVLYKLFLSSLSTFKNFGVSVWRPWHRWCSLLFARLAPRLSLHFCQSTKFTLPFNSVLVKGEFLFVTLRCKWEERFWRQDCHWIFARANIVTRQQKQRTTNHQHFNKNGGLVLRQNAL